MTYFSVCSGIEAASCAWEPIGYKAVGFSEIAPFPSSVLAQRFPKVKNFGDMTKYKEFKNVGKFDVMVGGTPCQSFSAAGLRKGLDDPRGNLMLIFGAMADHFKPTWIVWENVPGVLSSNRGRDFGTFLGMLEELGYGFAYRVLDAQYFGVAQRRRRVFLIGYRGDWRQPAKVLFESKSLCGDLAPKRGKEEKITGTITRGSGDRGYDFDQIANGGYVIMGSEQGNAAITQDYCSTLTSSSEAVIFAIDGVQTGARVRKLTPKECERLQGFPDDWTQIEWRGKNTQSCPDSLRYKAIGNSMAVPVMKWIGERIKKIGFPTEAASAITEESQ